MNGPRIFLSAHEASGDLHGANLVRALRRLAPDAQVAGLGGPRLAQAGCRLIADTADLGIVGVAALGGALGRYLRVYSLADRFVASWRPDVAVTVDNPGFHFLLGSRLRTRRIPVLWYIPPQLWAWAPGRVRKLARRFTHVACVLPHEEIFFRDHGVPVTFVGNPVVDHLLNTPLDTDFIRSLRTTPQERLIAILPGSRRHEISGILAHQLAVARTLQERHGPCRFVLALADGAHRQLTAPLVADSGLDVRTVAGKTHEVQSAADLALVASGTATLELAFYGTPMAVFYNISWPEWNLVGRWAVRVPHLSLPNILAGRPIVPETMRAVRPSPAFVDETCRLLVDADRRKNLRDALADIRRHIEKSGAAENAARLVLDLVGRPILPPSPWRPGFAM